MECRVCTSDLSERGAEFIVCPICEEAVCEECFNDGEDMCQDCANEAILAEVFEVF